MRFLLALIGIAFVGVYCSLLGIIQWPFAEGKELTTDDIFALGVATLGVTAVLGAINERSTEGQQEFLASLGIVTILLSALWLLSGASIIFYAIGALTSGLVLFLTGVIGRSKSVKQTNEG